MPLIIVQRPPGAGCAGGGINMLRNHKLAAAAEFLPATWVSLEVIAAAVPTRSSKILHLGWQAAELPFSARRSALIRPAVGSRAYAPTRRRSPANFFSERRRAIRKRSVVPN